MTTTLAKWCSKTLLALLFLVGTQVAHAQLLLNEINAANLTNYADNFGNHGDWVEIHNPSASPVSLQGWYISDNPNKPTKFQITEDISIPAGGYQVIFCSGRGLIVNGFIHASFKLRQTKNTPEEITLTNPQAVVVDSKKVKTLQRHHSYGRKKDGGDDWGITTKPTPGASNNTEKFYEGYAKKPTMDSLPGFYSSAVLVSITKETPGDTIRFTNSGNEPTRTSPMHNAPWNVTQTSVLKAKIYPVDTNLLPSFTEFNTYFINEDLTFTLPILSISGTQLLTLANGNQSLRPFGTLEMFNTQKERVARSTGELNSHGQDSWVNDQRGLDWISRDEMGTNAAVKEVLFPGLTERDEFQRIILRAAGDDNYPGGSNWPGNNQPPLAAHMRDAYTQNLAKRDGLHIDTRTGSKAIIYLNGRYWGVYDLRELPDDHDYTDYNFQQGKFDLDYLLTWGNTWAEYTTTTEDELKQDWTNFVEFVQNNDMADPANFDIVKEQFDYKSLVDYILVNSFSNASDWLNYNTGWWRGTNPDGGHKKWGYILWDLDATYAYYINYTGILDTGATAPPCNVEKIDLSGWSEPGGPSYPQQHLDLLRILQDNPEFRQYWITRQADLSKSTFGCDNMLSYFDEVLASIDGEMPRHITKWGGTYQQWRDNVAIFRHFIERRCEYFSTGLPDCYSVTGPYNTVLMVDPPLSGSIQANSLTYSELPTTTTFFGNIETLLKAVPAGTNTFVKWEVKNHTVANNTVANISIDMNQPDTIIAYFSGTSVPTVQVEQPKPSILVFPTVTNSGFAVDFVLPESAKVGIRLVDVAGKDVTIIRKVGGAEMIGNERIFVPTKGIAAGTYFVVFETDKGFRETKKVVISE
jgi:hypothetical protein